MRNSNISAVPVMRSVFPKFLLPMIVFAKTFREGVPRLFDEQFSSLDHERISHFSEGEINWPGVG